MCLTVENANKIYMKIIENEFILVLYPFPWKLLKSLIKVTLNYSYPKKTISTIKMVNLE